jgi:hypothetical protein
VGPPQLSFVYCQRVTITRARYWHFGTALICAASLILQFVLSATNKTTDPSPDGAALRMSNFFSYFTIQSNIIVLCVAVLLFLVPDRDGPVWRVFHLDAVMCITITCLVDVTVLRPNQHLAGLSNVADLGLHVVTPILLVAGWLLFGPRPRFDWGVWGYAMIFPILWLIYTLIRGPIVKWYPYPFIDVISHGYAKVTVNVLVVAALVLAIGALAVVLDRKMRPAPVPE